MKRKSLREWIKENRDELDACIIRACGGRPAHLNDGERRLWVLNDEGLYSWAKSDRVNI